MWATIANLSLNCTGTAITANDLPFRTTFASLPPAFYTRLRPTPVPAPVLVAASGAAAAQIGLTPDQLAQPEFVAVFSGNAVPAQAAPLAAVYAGHQFGVWAGQLGDGRALLLGDIATADGPVELQLKGAGRTPYSRMGDGRAVLRSSIREFLCSEAMAALGIPTTRALCVTASPLGVERETIETAAVVTRMAPSFIRFGSFEHWYQRRDTANLRALADYVLAQSYPALLDTPNPYQALLQEVARRTGDLVAQWQAVGFMHGVLNTDNMSILGQTLDYGPFGFMEAYDPDHICNHSDHHGRYAYVNQPAIGHWNCYMLANALLPLIGDVEAAQAALDAYEPAFATRLAALRRAKLGLSTEHETDAALFEDLLDLLAANRVDYPYFFRHLGLLGGTPAADDAVLRDLFADRAAFDQWLVRYRARLAAEQRDDAARRAAMMRVNPKYVLRNHLAQAAIEQAQQGDFAEVQRLLQVLERPFDEQPAHAAYAALPPAWAHEVAVSCSS